jgi:hypothetical protein
MKSCSYLISVGIHRAIGSRAYPNPTQASGGGQYRHSFL